MEPILLEALVFLMVNQSYWDLNDVTIAMERSRLDSRVDN